MLSLEKKKWTVKSPWNISPSRTTFQYFVSPFWPYWTINDLLKFLASLTQYFQLTIFRKQFFFETANLKNTPYCLLKIMLFLQICVGGVRQVLLCNFYRKLSSNSKLLANDYLDHDLTGCLLSPVQNNTAVLFERIIWGILSGNYSSIAINWKKSKLNLIID